MSKRIIVIHDTLTNEIIERELNTDEIAQQKIDDAHFLAQQAEAEAKEAARQAIFDRLGLTADEAKLLLG